LDQLTSTEEKEKQGRRIGGMAGPDQTRPRLPEAAASSESPKPRHAKDGRILEPADWSGTGARRHLEPAAASDADLSQKKPMRNKKSAVRLGAGGG